jgi:hypothetical protein
MIKVLPTAAGAVFLTRHTYMATFEATASALPNLKPVAAEEAAAGHSMTIRAMLEGRHCAFTSLRGEYQSSQLDESVQFNVK